jgi:hypothetical protein
MHYRFLSKEAETTLLNRVEETSAQSELKDKYLDDEEFTTKRFELAAKDYGDSSV